MIEFPNSAVAFYNKRVRVAIVQLNPIVGDVSGNVLRIAKAAERAIAERAGLAVFSELCLVGYPPRDLLMRKELFDAVEKELSRALLPLSYDISMIIGAPVKERGETYNSALLLREGKIAARQDKTLLPNYDVFDELRYFKPSTLRVPFVIGEEVVAVTICEDAWNDKDFWERRMYDMDPVEELVGKGARLVINISASPYHFGKRRFRAKMLSHSAKKYGIPIVFVNQVGGNDELIFDGSSMVINQNGEVVWEAKPFTEDFHIIDLENLPKIGKQPEELVEDISCVHDALVVGIRDYIHKTGFQRVVVGLSGGIDSSVTAALATTALGSDNVTGIVMPSRYSSSESLKDAEALAKNLGIGLKTYSIEKIFSSYLDTMNPDGKTQMDVAEENVQARIRGNILMFVSNREGALVLSTGNKSELAVGYCTLYGDMSGGLAVLADVPKMMVYELARYINRNSEIIPQSVLTKAPTAELKPNQRDEDTLPPYQILDPILKAYIEENLTVREITEMGFDIDLVRKIIRMVDNAEYKRRQSAPGLKVTTKAFGAGRRMPIVWRMGAHKQSNEHEC